MFSKILLAYDGSEPSKRALDHAAKMTAMFKGKLIILTVVPRIYIPTFAGPELETPMIDIPRLQEQLKEQYSKALNIAELEVRERYPDLEVEALLVEGRPSAVITEEAKRNSVGLIMMGSRGLGGLTGWVLGSTSRKVVDQCTKPILIVK